MARIARVNCCAECPFGWYAEHDEAYVCDAVVDAEGSDRRVESGDIIPDWCPLPEADWIPVGERLPGECLEVLVVGRYGPVGFTPSTHLADYLPGRAVSPWLSRCGERLFNVTHWRPLPPLPEEASDDATE